VGNRRVFEAALAKLTQAGKLDDIALLVADADGVKSVNDNLGHPAGDALLRAIASTLVRRLRPQDRLYRTGGDEFAAIVGRCEVDDIAHRLGGTLVVEVDGIGRGSASIGVATAVPGSSAVELMSLADRRMYRSKSSAAEAGSRP
jgi:diguanylate cyclase (GGDEF)-like protein